MKIGSILRAAAAAAAAVSVTLGRTSFATGPMRSRAFRQRRFCKSGPPRQVARQHRLTEEQKQALVADIFSGGRPFRIGAHQEFQRPAEGRVPDQLDDFNRVHVLVEMRLFTNGAFGKEVSRLIRRLSRQPAGKSIGATPDQFNSPFLRSLSQVLSVVLEGVNKM